MPHITATQCQPDGSALHAVETDDGERFVIRTLPWHSEAGTVIGWQSFIVARDELHPDTDAAEAAALELVEAVYVPSRWLGGA